MLNDVTLMLHIPHRTSWLLFNSEITVGDEELSWDMEDIHVGDDVVIRPLHERHKPCWLS